MIPLSHSQAVLPNTRILVLDHIERTAEQFRLFVTVQQRPACPICGEISHSVHSYCGVAATRADDQRHVRTGIDRKTISKYLAQPEGRPVYGPRTPRPNKLDAFKPYLQDRLKAGVWNATVLLREVRALGFGELLAQARFRMLDQEFRPAVTAGNALWFVRLRTATGPTAPGLGVAPRAGAMIRKNDRGGPGSPGKHDTEEHDLSLVRQGRP